MENVFLGGKVGALGSGRGGGWKIKDATCRKMEDQRCRKHSAFMQGGVRWF